MNQFTYRRPELASDLCSRLAGAGLADARSGLFLAAPRRVGKSTFLKEDLIPEAGKRGWLAIYVDLWSRKDRDPATLIADAVKSQLQAHEGSITRAARGMKLAKVSVFGALTLDLSQPGLPPDVTLSDLLVHLQALARKPIVLIIDEAQHALLSESGMNTMFALKSARDQINASTGVPQLMLVLTGSNRDKLAHLVLNRSQPFFGSSITAFPLLDQRFTDAFAEWANAALADGNKFEAGGVYRAFQLLGHRPEMLRELMGQIALGGEAGSFTSVLEVDAAAMNNRLWDEFDSEFESLTPLQKAVLQALIAKGPPWSPFSEESMADYRSITGQATISPASVQTALDALRQRNLVWRESRGAYALEDQGFAEWFRHRRMAARKLLPPSAP